MMSVLAIVLMAAGCWWFWFTIGASRLGRWRKPLGLAGARLVFVETMFRTEHPIPVAARIDRAYLMANDRLVLVELKSRRRNVVYHSDVVQLSAQKIAVEGATGMDVASYAFVSIRRGSKWQTTRVDLLDAVSVVALVQRRRAILEQTVPPRFAESRHLCAQCPFSEVCDRSLQRRRSASQS